MTCLPEATDELIERMRDATGMEAVHALLSGLCRCGMAESNGPWDVFVDRGPSEHHPVVSQVEAEAAIRAAFPEYGIGSVSPVDEGHFLITQLPPDVVLVLESGEYVERSLSPLHYRVIIPAIPAEVANLPEEDVA